MARLFLALREYSSCAGKITEKLHYFLTNDMGCKGAWFLLVAAVSLTCVSGDTLLLESQILNQTDESTINSLTNTAGLVSNTHLSHLKNIETKEIRPKTTNLIEKITSIASSQISTGFPDSLIPTPSYPFCTTGPGCNVFQRPSSTSPTSGVEMRVTDEVASTFLELETQNSHTSISIDHQVPTNISVSKNSSNITNEDIDECRFMSFEEWKRQKQEEAAAESVSASSASAASSADLLSSHTLAKVNTSTVDTTYSSPSNIAQEEDQGRVYKKKFNYASSDCAATIMKANSEAKGALAILHENKDSYLLNQCSSSNKYVIIELCQDILVSEVVMGNFEFFSSMFKDIRISVSDQFPATKWEVLGEFEAENVRDLQVFTVRNPLIWARYLKLEIVSHYGNEFYCPISVVRVHGKTMMEEFKEEQKGVDQVPSMNITIATDVANITTQNLNNYSTRDDECRVILPHLLLHEFLQDINGTDQYCAAVAVDREVKTIETTATTQESIYKNIMKRLSLLESNATLSLLYIEEQSKLLSTAFTNLERRQTSTFNDLVQSFNITMLSQVKIMKEAYERIQKEATMLLQNQENRYRGGLSDANYKLGMLANDLRFHKRIIIFNTLIIICLLVYVVLTRDTAIGDYITKEKRSQRWGQFTVSKKSALKRKSRKRAN